MANLFRSFLWFPYVSALLKKKEKERKQELQDGGSKTAAVQIT